MTIVSLYSESSMTAATCAPTVMEEMDEEVKEIPKKTIIQG